MGDSKRSRDTLGNVIIPMTRNLVRTGAAGVFLALVGVGGAGFADTPSNWADSPNVSAFHFLLVIFLIPLALFIVIASLTSLPSWVKQGTSSEVVPRERDEQHLDVNQH